MEYLNIWWAQLELRTRTETKVSVVSTCNILAFSLAYIAWQFIAGAEKQEATLRTQEHKNKHTRTTTKTKTTTRTGGVHYTG